MSNLKSQEMRKVAPELDPLRIGTGWTPEDLAKPQVIIESTYGDSHPGRRLRRAVFLYGYLRRGKSGNGRH